MNKIKTDFVIIGSGIAGLSAAIAASEYGKVLIVTKAKMTSGSTEHAQGGVAVAMSIKDNTKLHFADTISAGAELCDPEAVWILVTEGLERIKELIQWGTKFDRKDGELTFTKEGAHRKRRVIHAQGDATGQELERSLLSKTDSVKTVKFMEYFFTIDLLVKEGKCYGISGFDRNTNEKYMIYSKAVILATGGAGQVFSNTTNPLVSTGDGVAMASRAGAYITDMEFIQFHPTALALDIKPRFLISEAVRGEGAILLNHKGKRFMEDYPMKELAPRDVVARAIFNEMKRENKDFVYLDLSGISKKKILARFPTIYSFCKKYNLDITRDPIPVAPSAHYMIGGVKT
ncbi:MAG TPA: FAD-dependent oxidoreductase, partial [Firmicutes bacterium]|nr:FAD-dependent oxidoreductase [Bacillota bacterium]